MTIPKFLYPKYIDILLAKNKSKKIPNLNNFDNFKKNKILENLENLLNKLHIDIKNNYNRYIIELTPEKNKKKNNPIVDFISNNKIFKDEADKINEKGNFSNGFRKMYEILKHNKILENKEIIKHFDICSMPGAFILATNHYIKTILRKKYDWYGQSFIKDEKQIFGDDYKIYEINKNKLLVGIKGDITIIENILYYKYFFEENKRNFVTSDCGLLVSENKEYYREKQMLKLLLSQFVSGITVLEKGGTFLMKFYVFFGNFSISLIYLMSLFFEEVRLIKPESSRQPKGKEIYLLCLNFKDNLKEKNLQQLLSIIKNFNILEDYDKNIIDYKNINKEILKNIEEGLVYYNKIFLERLIKSKEFYKKEIEYDMFEETEKYLKKREFLTKQYKKYSNNYKKKYLKRMKYKRINNNDKLN